jgi:osmotically-inducible protein OsmY
MYKLSPKLRSLPLAIVASLAIAGGSMGLAATETEITNARQESQIWTTYALSPYLRANDLQVTVDAGKATLTGKVDEDVTKELAGQIAQGVVGITDVDNQIEVLPDYSVPERSKERSFGDVIDDASITSAIKNKLLWSKYASGLQTDVDTSWGQVQLKGSADSAAAKATAGSLAINTRGVHSVDNQLVVDSARPAPEQSVMQEVSDAWITTKVKSTYMYSSNVDGSDISVNTQDGKVTLAGKVDSGAEQALAIEMAGNVRGVKSVNSEALAHAD